MKALSIKQPWAWLIVSGIKDIENRTWKCPEKYIGQRVLIQASGSPQSGFYKDFIPAWSFFSEDQKQVIIQESAIRSAIIGSVRIVDCVINHPSIWAEKRMPEPQRKDFEWNVIGEGVTSFDGDAYDMAMIEFNKSLPIYNWVLANPILFPEPIPAKGKLSFWDYPNIIAEPEEKGGELFCHCQLPVKEESQVMSIGNYQYQCRYCGGLWYK
jgi:hypothetical protein